MRVYARRKGGEEFRGVIEERDVSNDSPFSLGVSRFIVPNGMEKREALLSATPMQSVDNVLGLCGRSSPGCYYAADRSAIRAMR